MFGVSYSRFLHQNKKNSQVKFVMFIRNSKETYRRKIFSDSAVHIIEKHATTVKYVREQTKVKPYSKKYWLFQCVFLSILQ